jgi:hypothetical protein
MHVLRIPGLLFHHSVQSRDYYKFWLLPIQIFYQMQFNWLSHFSYNCTVQILKLNNHLKRYVYAFPGVFDHHSGVL